MLCHDHASTFKLPELDAETSMQGKIEKSIDEKYDQIATKKLKKVQQVTPDKNPFSRVYQVTKTLGRRPRY